MNQEIKLFQNASKYYLKTDFDPLFKLKASENIDDSFKKTFSKFYGLNHAGLTSKWKEKYFEILNEYTIQDENNPYQKPLEELYEISRKIGDRSFQASFVTKLVSFNNECYPIFDKHVSNYFGIKIPKNTDLSIRIYRFTVNMINLKKEYQKLSEFSEFELVKNMLFEKDDRLRSLHDNRIIDMLIWIIGKNRITTAST